MKNELTIREESPISAAAKIGLDSMLKPLLREVPLLDTFVSGSTYLADGASLEKVREGDSLVLRRENNKLDEYRILVLDNTGGQLGYVPEMVNFPFSRLMDEGKQLTARVTGIHLYKDYKRIEIRIFLVDY